MDSPMLKIGLMLTKMLRRMSSRINLRSSKESVIPSSKRFIKAWVAKGKLVAMTVRRKKILMRTYEL